MSTIEARRPRTRLTMLRVRTGMSLAELGGLVERSTITLSRVERKEAAPGPELSHKLEAIFGEPISELLRDTEGIA